MMQTIDTWSFGCVLSVAATWVVLGFQGIRQYTKLRTLAPSNRTEDGKITDRFHDGTRVLEEVKRWHTFLRGHLRTADTATPLVLDLIETQMLLTDPWTRSEAKPLCQELAKRVKQAKAELTALPLQMRETHDSVKLALWEMEKEAHNEDNLSRTDTTLLRRTARASSFASSITETNTLPQVPGPSHAVSKRVRKEAMIKNTPLAKTPYRQEILEEELPFLEKSSTAPTAGFHEGETTHSPVDDNPNPFKGASSASNSQGWNRRRAPRNPNTRPGPSQNTSKAPAGQTPSHGDHGPPRPPSDVPKLGKPSPRHHSPQPSKSNLSLANGFVDKPHRHVEFDSTVNSKQPESTSEPRDQSPDPSQLPTPDQTPSASPASIPQFSSLAYQNLSPRQTPALQETTVLHPMPDIPQQISTSPPNPDHCGSLGTAGSLSSVQNRNHSHLEPKTAPQIGGDEAGMIKLSQSPISDPKTSNPPETSPRSYSPRSPNGVNKPHDASDVPIIVTPEDDQSKDQKPFVSSSVTTDVKSGHTDKEIPNASNEEPWHDPESLGKSLAFTPLPTDVYQLPWEICTVRQVLDGKKPKTAFNKMVKSFMRVEEKDEHLAQFIHNRDLVGPVDDAHNSRLLTYW
ncbi:hypothetical protein K469DRAFT_374146 [Zopfia rhizophila CBS 207.26]|uniref:Protein kinase domain-containing protein n=1 Tax=Zopfia rhizophila CBS 207.26 TaxID=1314779 RepID=A0A6A6EIR9_9PEZI|nr:hypothetical protein K469DRAFT_374146 [Zopfia rhizophila CBS 207.26]